MTLNARLLTLERNRPDPMPGVALDLDLPPDMCTRIIAVKAAGTFPQSLADADLEAIVAAADKAKGKT